MMMMMTNENRFSQFFKIVYTVWRTKRPKICRWTIKHLSWSKSNWIYLFSEKTFIYMYIEIPWRVDTSYFNQDNKQSSAKVL